MKLHILAVLLLISLIALSSAAPIFKKLALKLIPVALGLRPSPVRYRFAPEKGFTKYHTVRYRPAKDDVTSFQNLGVLREKVNVMDPRQDDLFSHGPRILI